METSTSEAAAPGKPPAGPESARAGWAWLRPILAAGVGGGLAAAYAYFVGCRTGTCPLTSNVWTATLYGGSVGAVVFWPSRRRPASDEHRLP